jgi:matrix metalloproteinase-13 (collagenase 3)
VDKATQAKLWLIQFGYVQGEVTPDKVQEGLEAAQAFYGLPVTGALDAKTVQALLEPKRCGVRDVGMAREAMARWGKKDLTYFLADLPQGMGLNETRTRQIIQESFDAWSGACDLRFHEVQSDRANIIMELARGNRSGFDGPGGTLAYAYLPPTVDFNGQLVMRWDMDEQWGDRPDGPYIPLGAVTTHENGHLIGLDHSRTPGQLMYPTLDKRVLTVQSEDGQRAAALYGKASQPVPPRPTVPVVPTVPGTFPATIEVQVRVGGASGKVYAGNLSARG